MTDNRNMEAVKTIYKILSAFEKQLDAESFDPEYISPERLKISQQRRDRYLQMLIESEYITGMAVTDTNAGLYITMAAPRITLKGIEYLASNSAMHKAMEVIKKGAELSVSII